MTRIERFGDTREMNVATLRVVLAGEDARSRIYAIWALGLCSAPVGQFVEHLRGEPEPGVRRALAVVLAGQGEMDLVVALGRHDPDVHVRASICQLLVRFARAGQAPWSAVTGGLSDEADVRAAVLSQVDAVAPAEVRQLAVACLDDEDADVRREAFETAVRFYKAGMIDGPVLSRALERMSSSDCKLSLSSWVVVDPPSSLALALAGASAPIRELVLRMRPDLAFTDLLPLIVNDFDLFHRLRYALALDLRQAPLALILQLTPELAWYDEYVHEATVRLFAYDKAPAGSADLLSRLQTVCDLQLAEIDDIRSSPERLAAYEAEYQDEFDDAPEDLGERQRRYATLRDHLVRLRS